MEVTRTAQALAQSIAPSFFIIIHRQDSLFRPSSIVLRHSNLFSPPPVTSISHSKPAGSCENLLPKRESNDIGIFPYVIRMLSDLSSGSTGLRSIRMCCKLPQGNYGKTENSLSLKFLTPTQLKGGFYHAL